MLPPFLSKIYPQSRTDGEKRAVDTGIVFIVFIDGAVVVDTWSVVRMEADPPRPQPPTAIAIAGFISALRVTVFRSLTLTSIVRTEIFVHFSYTEKEDFISGVPER